MFAGVTARAQGAQVRRIGGYTLMQNNHKQDKPKRMVDFYDCLVGGFKQFLFSIIYGIILPIGFHIFQDG